MKKQIENKDKPIDRTQFLKFLGIGVAASVFKKSFMSANITQDLNSTVSIHIPDELIVKRHKMNNNGEVK